MCKNFLTSSLSTPEFHCLHILCFDSIKPCMEFLISLYYFTHGCMDMMSAGVFLFSFCHHHLEKKNPLFPYITSELSSSHLLPTADIHNCIWRSSSIVSCILCTFFLLLLQRDFDTVVHECSVLSVFPLQMALRSWARDNADLGGKYVTCALKESCYCRFSLGFEEAKFLGIYMNHPSDALFFTFLRSWLSKLTMCLTMVLTIAWTSGDINEPLDLKCR